MTAQTEEASREPQSRSSEFYMFEIMDAEADTEAV
jgi:hypothetical protein